MDAESTANNPTYLYAIVPSFPTEDLGPIGLYGSQVRTLADGHLTAVVSALPSDEELRPERHHLAAHQAVVNRVLSESPVVLPVSFGTIADSAQGVRDLLDRYGPELTDQMQKVKGKIQMNVRLTYTKNDPNVFQYLVESRHPEIKSMLDSMFAGGRQPSRDEKIDLGQKLDSVLSDARDQAAQQAEAALASHCDAVKRNTPRAEKELVRLACLLAKDRQEAFDAAVQEAAKRFEDAFALEEGGPFPPYDFTELHLRV